MFMMHLRETFHIPSSNGSLAIAIKLQVKYRFRAAAMFLYSTKRYFDKSCIYSQTYKLIPWSNCKLNIDFARQPCFYILRRGTLTKVAFIRRPTN